MHFDKKNVFDINVQINDREMIDTISLVFNKAFDTNSHEIILDKLVQI